TAVRRQAGEPEPGDRLTHHTPNGATGTRYTGVSSRHSRGLSRSYCGPLGDGKMTVAVNIDTKKYGRLLAKTLPVAVQTEAQNERMLAEIWKLMIKKSLTPEEEALLVLMSELVERFEERHYHIDPAPPHEILKMLMEDRGLRQRDLLHIFKSSGIASEVVT